MGKNTFSAPVTTEYGQVQGFRQTTSTTTCTAFLGVPYASPPIGPLRFQKPVPPQPWEGVKRCTQYGDRSIQRDMFWDKVIMRVPQSEDCLYLNIFTPSTETPAKFPVMFYIHGGGFMMDSAAKYEPRDVCENLARRGIVVVTIQYRLGYLGFFSLGTSACKGNFGLWDQVMALQWTKRNIAAFGGDPDRITVSGQSAGGVSTDLLSLSPVSRDLFSQKMCLGGNAYCHWAISKQEDITAYCKKKAVKLGWKPREDGYKDEDEESRHIIDYLKTVPPHKFATHMIGNKTIFTDSKLPLTPVIDGELLPLSVNALRSTAPSKPSIVGVGEHEALLFVALGFKRCNGKFMSQIEQGLAERTRGGSIKEVKAAITAIYGDMKTSVKCVTVLSDIISNHACYRLMQNHATNGAPVWAYSFDHTSKNRLGWLKAALPFFGGTHASELLYLFNCNYFVSPLPPTKEDREVSEITSSMFASFVRTGNPNESGCGVSWEEVGEKHKMLSIQPKAEMKKKSFVSRMETFDDFLRKYQMINEYVKE